MNIRKEKIQQRFDASSDTYEKVATVQKACADILSSMLVQYMSDFHPSSILDLGTGTGYMTEFLMSMYPQSRYTLNDISPNMLDVVRQKFSGNSHFFFHSGDMESVDFGYQDVVVSNLALQWVDQLEVFIKKLYANSKVLAFSCLLDGTFAEWEAIVRKFHEVSPIKEYPSSTALCRIVASLGSGVFSFDERRFCMQFQNAKDFMRYLQHLGASVGVCRIPFSCLKSIVAANQGFEVSYNVFFCTIRRI